MKKIPIAVICSFCLFINSMQAQHLLHKKLLVDISVQNCRGFGPSATSNEGVILPGLIGNMNSGEAITLAAKYRTKKTLGFSLAATSSRLSGWADPEGYTLFQGAEFNQISIKPGLLISTRYTPTGIFNRLSIYSVIGPVIGFSHVSLGESISSTFETGNSDIQFSGNHLGVNIDLMINYGVSRYLNVHLTSSYSQYWRNSEILYEKSYGMLYVGTGIGFKFMFDRNFLYD